MAEYTTDARTYIAYRPIVGGGARTSFDSPTLPDQGWGITGGRAGWMNQLRQRKSVCIVLSYATLHTIVRSSIFIENDRYNFVELMPCNFYFHDWMKWTCISWLTSCPVPTFCYDDSLYDSCIHYKSTTPARERCHVVYSFSLIKIYIHIRQTLRWCCVLYNNYVHIQSIFNRYIATSTALRKSTYFSYRPCHNTAREPEASLIFKFFISSSHSLLINVTYVVKNWSSLIFEM